MSRYAASSGPSAARWPMCVAAALLVAWQVIPVAGQTTQAGRGRQRGPERHERERGLSGLRGLFHPSRADHGPPAPGELEELREFAEEHVPRLNALLERVDRRNPRELRRASRRLVPRLRMLRRLHEESPRLAQVVAEHTENMFQLRLLQRRWRHAAEDERGVLRDDMRVSIAENVKLQADALTLWADRLEARRGERVSARLEALVADGADLAGMPPPLRERVAAIRKLEDAEARARAEAELRERMERWLVERVELMRERAEQLRADAEQETDRRLKHMLEHRGRHGRRGRGP